jgi:hypothetical protein
VDRKTVAWEDVAELVDRSPVRPGEVGWQVFLSSWRWAAILVVGCVAGLVAIVSAHPFASASVSERVTERLGQPASCTEVGAARIADVQSKIYRCTVGAGARASTRCFSVAGSDVKLLVGKRELGC